MAVNCASCRDEGHVCEDHPDFPWEGRHGSVQGHAEHGAVGMPCPRCCAPIEQAGKGSIAAAFVPKQRIRGVA